MQAIEDYVRSATDLTRQLLGLARGGKYEVSSFDINDLLSKSATMFGRTKKEIRIHTMLDSSPPVVDADRSQIEQVLLNLYVNAWQAMPDGGEIYLQTQTVDLDAAFCKPYRAHPGRFVKISITDTGIGMDDFTRGKIFDPFFTTKGKSRGTGLGLASAYGIIDNHEGIITVYSEPGHGTTFDIYLPLSKKTACRNSRMAKQVVEGSETILLVDDEAIIRNVGQAMLERLGYRVVTTSEGEQALDIVKRMGNEIDLVILDLIMPGMSGKRVFDGLMKIRPDIRVLLSSGYAMNGEVEEILKSGCNGFIQKPFNLAEFSQKIRKLLNAPMRSD
jgi:two-component system cell cycle sensor histidine kinase/response regulator CckA